MMNSVAHDVHNSQNSQNTMDNEYEAMDTSEGPSDEQISPTNSQEIHGETDSLLIAEPIDNDSYNMNIDVPYVEDSLRDGENISNENNGLANNIIGEHTSSASDVQLNQTIVLDSSGSLSYTSVTMCKPSIINIETTNMSIIKSSIMMSSNCNEVQKVPEVGTSQDGTSQCINSSKLTRDEKELIPPYGTPVCPKTVKRAGPYILGPLIGTSPVKSIVQCLARKEGTDKYYTIKILTLKDDNEHETQDDRQGKMLLHAEYSLLSLLQNQDGVVHHHGFFKDSALGEKSISNGRIYTGKIKRRLCLVLDCLTSHDFNPRNEELLNLQHHVIKEKKLSEKESLLIFTDTVRIVAELHKRNIVHRDLKLGNLVLNRKTRKVTITNFCLGKHLASENDLLKDQRGSPAYISPDVLCGKPYLGKPSDMWALGVVLFTMLYGQFPFYDSSPTQLFNKIKAVNYHIPLDGRVSGGTIELIRNLLVLQPSRRLTAVQVLDSLATIIETFKIPASIGEEDQVVPDIENIKEDLCDKKTELNEKMKPIYNRHYDLFKKITFQEQMLQWLNQSQSPLVPQARPYGQIPVHRVNSDPRELTPAELERYRHLIPGDHQRSHSHTSVNRRESSSRTRSTSRYRSTPSNVSQGRQNLNTGSNLSNNSISNENNSNGSSVTNSGISNLNTRNSEPIPWTSGSNNTTLTLSNSSTINQLNSSRLISEENNRLNTPAQRTSVNSNNSANYVINRSVFVSPTITSARDTREQNERNIQNLNRANLSSSWERLAEFNARYNRGRVTTTNRTSLSNRNDQPNTGRTNTTNRSTSTTENRNYYRVPINIADQIMALRAILQPNTANQHDRNIENPRTDAITNSIRARYSMPRRNLLALNRNSPYMTNLRYLTTNRNISNDISNTNRDQDIINNGNSESVINNSTGTGLGNNIRGNSRNRREDVTFVPNFNNSLHQNELLFSTSHQPQVSIHISSDLQSRQNEPGTDQSLSQDERL
ncbi:probable serine/threonine-protein kinase MARK-B [Chelonus insularis]|uniref:probable serine/threonine-protein kinase MARK-B n=1 Tax=Chelonus insularis TaxID=460826 RepID=UPI00158BB4C8|nr:probable serine/threonine-protein kinase MARK-B [Chelonus insularis]XP_034936141.1 probable serine/threonine-protein kinase MARK-B [Chelonus insularis]XP_034936143.1 probable serine/threonine-protein kinase MARK-B [Chelonus insularis]